MTSIVRKRAFHNAVGLLRASPQYKRARLAMGIGQYVWKNRATVMRAAARARKAWQARKSQFKHSNFGNRPKSSVCKKFSSVDELTTHDTRTLYSWELTSIPKNNTANDIDLRNRQAVTIKGFKLCMEFENTLVAPTRICVNVAVVCVKQEGSFGPNDAFFRGYGDSRNVNFSGALSSNDLHCRPINADRMQVLMHKRFMLTQNGHGESGTSQKALNQYIKVNRQFRYEKDQDSPEKEPIWLYVWCDKFLEPSGSAVRFNTMLSQIRVMTYFRDPP